MTTPIAIGTPLFLRTKILSLITITNRRRRSGLLFSRNEICAVLALLVVFVFSAETKSQGPNSSSPQSKAAVAAVSRETARPQPALKEKAANTVFAEASDTKATAVNQPRSGSGGGSLLKSLVMIPVRIVQAFFDSFGEGSKSVANSTRGGVGEVIDSKIPDGTAVAKPHGDTLGVPVLSAAAATNESRLTSELFPVWDNSKQLGENDRSGDMDRTGAFPEPTNVVKPAYPPLAAAKNISGTVLVDVQIDSGGIVRQASAVSGPSLLHKAAIEAARRWRFDRVEINDGPRMVRLAFVFRPSSYVPASGESDYTPPYQMAVTWTAEVGAGIVEKATASVDVESSSLVLRGATEKVEVGSVNSPSKYAMTPLYLTLKLGITNNGKMPLIFLRRELDCNHAVIAKNPDELDIRDGKFLAYSGATSSELTSPEWEALRQKLNMWEPPAAETLTLAPGQTFVFDSWIRMDLPIVPEMYATSPTRSTSIVHLKEVSPVLLKLRCDAWPANLEEPGTEREKLEYGRELRRRWKDFGLLWLDEIYSQPITIDLTAIQKTGTQ